MGGLVTGLNQSLHTQRAAFSCEVVVCSPGTWLLSQKVGVGVLILLARLHLLFLLWKRVGGLVEVVVRRRHAWVYWLQAAWLRED